MLIALLVFRPLSVSAFWNSVIPFLSEKGSHVVHAGLELALAMGSLELVVLLFLLLKSWDYRADTTMFSFM